MFNFLFRYLILLPFNFLFMLVALIFNPLVIFFIKEDGTFPPFLCWFETWDARHLFFDGSGEIQADWLDIHWKFLRPLLSYPKVHLYLCRLLWLYRNCGYGFAYYVCGATYNRHYIISRTYTSPEGALDVYMESYFDSVFRRSGFYPYKLFNYKFGFDYYVGWKLQAGTGESDGRSRAMFAMRINPFKGAD